MTQRYPKRNLILVLLAVSGWMCFLPPAAWSSELAVIVNPANPMKEISQTQLVAIYMGKMTSFEGNGAIRPVDYMDSSDLKKDFYERFLDKDIEKIKRYWVKIIFSGRGSPPKALDKPSDVLGFVAENDGGIGYIPKEMVDGRVKELVLK